MKAEPEQPGNHAAGVAVDRRVRPDDVAALLNLIDARDKWRQEVMPDEREAIMMMFEAWQRLKELGWRDAEYAPADGRPLELLEIGSTGIHKGYRETLSPSPFPVKSF
jgi:hypothetical protein